MTEQLSLQMANSTRSQVSHACAMGAHALSSDSILKEWLQGTWHVFMELGRPCHGCSWTLLPPPQQASQQPHECVDKPHTHHMPWCCPRNALT